MTDPLDTTPIRRRLDMILKHGKLLLDPARFYAIDIPVLLAEIERLQAKLRAYEKFVGPTIPDNIEKDLPYDG